MNNRAFSILEIKSVDEEKRIIRGVATTPTVDRVGDIIDPLGVKFDNPLPLLWQHEHDKPIGSVKFDKPTKAGISFEAEIASTDEPGTLKDRLDEAWQSIKMGLVRAVSIGFRAIEYAFMDSGGVRYVETEVYELSAVTIPANADALITSVKSIDARLRAEHGIPDPEIPANPADDAATGKSVCVVKLDAPARDRAPFVITKIHPERART
jgi:HK97 family phage prohead protease